MALIIKEGCRYQRGNGIQTGPLQLTAENTELVDSAKMYPFYDPITLDVFTATGRALAYGSFRKSPEDLIFEIGVLPDLKTSPENSSALWL